MNFKTLNFNIQHKRSVIEPVDRVISDGLLLKFNAPTRRVYRIGPAIHCDHSSLYRRGSEIQYAITKDLGHHRHSKPHTVVDRCVWHLKDFGKQYSAPSTRLPLSPYLSLIQDKGFVELSQNFCHSRAVYASLKFTLSSFVSETLISFDYILSILMGSLCTSLTSPAALEHLEFNI